MARILEVCEPPDGGAAVHTAELTLGLRRRGFEVEYAGPREARRYEALETAGVTVHRLDLAPSYFNTRDDVSAYRGIATLLDRGRYDLIHLHSAKAGVLGRLAAGRAGVPAVYSPHGFPFVGEFSRSRIAAATTIERRLASRSAAIVCVCDWELRLAGERGLRPRRELSRIYNGVPPDPGNAVPPPELRDWSGDGPIVGAICGLRYGKRADRLIEATPAILAGDPGVRVAIIGDGPLRPELATLAASLGLDRDPRFKMLPFAATAPEYLAGLALYITPSAWEAFPVGVLEALAAGVPQVATDVGGTSEAVIDGATGVLIPPGDVGAIVDAVAMLLADPERRRAMAVASQRRQRKNFTLESMIDSTAELYERLVEAEGARP
jgi:glycosyltransferase involved in cell wall biosynthesis